MKLSESFYHALQLAFELHRDQQRKGSGVPYLSHLLSVAALVLEAGGDEEEAIAGLLHDAVEDQGGLETLARIRAGFGERVADIVLACSDSTEVPKPPWRQRKEAYLAHLEQAAPSVLLVSCADKLHNARSILADHHTVGPALWERFRASRDETLWYYRALVDLFTRRGPQALCAQLEPTVELMAHLP